LIIIVCILALLFLVIACACIYSLKKAADNARRDRVVTIIGNIEYFNNSPSISRTNQVAHQKIVNNRISTQGGAVRINGDAVGVNL